MRFSPALVVLLAACDPALDADPADVCGEQSSRGMQVIALDVDGLPIDGATASVAVDGGDPRPCLGTGETIVCLWAGDGAIDVRAEAPGHATADAMIEVDACDVLTDALVLELARAP